MNKQLLLGVGVSLALTFVASTATAQSVAPFSAPKPKSADQLAGGPATATPPSGSVAMQYNGPLVFHVPGEKQGMYAKKIDIRADPAAFQAFVSQNGPKAVQDAVDGTLEECKAIFELESMLYDYDVMLGKYEKNGSKLSKDLPRHVAWQMFLTGVGGAFDIGVGSATGGTVGGLYIGGRVTGTVKQWGNDKWAGRLDEHFLMGTNIQVQGTKIFIASERIYMRSMAQYVCPQTEAWKKQNGNQPIFIPTTPAS